MRRHELTAREWAVLGPLLDTQCRKQGGATKYNHLFISDFIRRVRTGIPWRDLPERFGNWNSVARRFARWARKKVWHRLFRAIQEPDWEWVLVDSTAVKAHPQAAGPKKQCRCRGPRPQPQRADDKGARGSGRAGQPRARTTAFEGPAGPLLRGMLHLQSDNVYDLVIEADGFTCSVHLDPDNRRR